MVKFSIVTSDPTEVTLKQYSPLTSLLSIIVKLSLRPVIVMVLDISIFDSSYVPASTFIISPALAAANALEFVPNGSLVDPFPEPSNAEEQNESFDVELSFT